MSAEGLDCAGSKVTLADSVAKLTDAAVPGTRFSAFSIRAVHAAHVIPSSVSSTRSCLRAPPSVEIRVRLPFRFVNTYFFSGKAKWESDPNFWFQYIPHQGIAQIPRRVHHRR